MSWLFVIQILRLSSLVISTNSNRLIFVPLSNLRNLLQRPPEETIFSTKPFQPWRTTMGPLFCRLWLIGPLRHPSSTHWQTSAKYTNYATVLQRRDCRASNKRTLISTLEAINWTPLYRLNSCEDQLHAFQSVADTLHGTFLVRVQPYFVYYVYFFWFTKLKLLNFQFGSVKMSSTTHALVHLVHQWLSALETPNTLIWSCLIDFSKAFDRIDHNILLHKLQLLTFLLCSWIGVRVSFKTDSNALN